MSKKLLKNTKIWGSSQCDPNFFYDLVLKGSNIESINDAHSDSSRVDLETIDLGGLVLMPAGIDPQVHFRVPGQIEKERPETVLAAVRQGGICAALNMPNTRPVIDCVAALSLGQSQIAAAAREAGVKVLFSGAITLGQLGKQTVDFASLHEAGAYAFTDDGLGVVDDKLMAEAFRASVELGCTILQHAEYPGHHCSLAPGPVQESLGLPAYLEEQETRMVERDLKLLCDYPKAKYHVLHVSAASTVSLIAKARDAGLNVSCEVSPHHLYFCANDINPNDKSFKMNPPLRSKDDRDFLRDSLGNGLIDFVATDHAPHESSSKNKPFPGASFGTLGTETSLSCLLTLYKSGQLTSKRLVEVFSTKPAAFLGLNEKQGYGSIEIGHELKAIAVDIESEHQITVADLPGQSKNSCFLGTTLQGKIVHRFF